MKAMMKATAMAPAVMSNIRAKTKRVRSRPKMKGIPTNTQSEPLVNPMLTRIHDLLKRVRDFVGLVAQSSPVHEYMRRMCKDNKLPGQVSNSKREEIYCLVNSEETSCTEWTCSRVETSPSQKMCEIWIIMSKEIDPQKMRFVLIRSCERRTQWSDVLTRGSNRMFHCCRVSSWIP